MYFLRLHPNIKLRVLTLFITSMSTNMIFPFMAIYFASKIGATQASLFLSLIVVINFAASIYGGNLSDRIGRRKIMLFSEFLRLFCFIMFAISNSPWLELPYVTLIFFMISNIGSGLFNPASEAMLLDVSEPEERKYIYSVIYWISNLSIAIGGTLGAYFFNSNLFILFLVLVVSSLTSSVITFLFITETLSVEDKGINKASKKLEGMKSFVLNYKKIVKDRLFLIFVLSSLLLFSLEAHLINFISLKLEDNIHSKPILPFEWSFNIDGIELLGYLRAENTISVIVFSLIVTALIRKRNEKSMIFSGFLLYAVGYGILSMSNQPWILLVVMVFAVLGEVIAFPIHQSLLGDIIPSHLRSSYLALNRIALKGSMLLGTVGIYFYSIWPAAIMSGFVWLSGAIGVILLYFILPDIYARRRANQETDQQHQAG